MFNALYATLDDTNAMRRVEKQDDVENLAPGDIVEVVGEFLGNPLQELLSFFAQALPYFALSQQEALQAASQVDVAAVQAEVARLQSEAQELRQQANQAARSGNPARRAEGKELTTAQAAAKEAEARQTADVAIQALSRGPSGRSKTGGSDAWADA